MGMIEDILTSLGNNGKPALLKLGCLPSMIIILNLQLNMWAYLAQEGIVYIDTHIP